jgi:hypothetical protein
MIDAISLAAPWCGGAALLMVGSVMVMARGRERTERAPRPARMAFEERLRDLGFRNTGGVWSGRSDGRKIRVRLLDDPQATPPVVQEWTTPVPTGELLVRIGDSEASEVQGSRNRMGDEAFDRWFEVSGSAHDLSLLDAVARRALANAARAARPRIEQGVLVMNAPGPMDVDARLAPLAAVASALASSAAIDPDRRMRQLASRDPEAGVRLRFFEILALELRGAELIELARASAEDPHPSVRTQAAVILADPVRLLAIVKSEDSPYRDRRKAGAALVDKGDEGQRIEAAVALAQGPVKVHGVALELAMSLWSSSVSVEPVLRMLLASPDAEIARQAESRLSRSAATRPRPAATPRGRDPFEVQTPPSGGDQDRTVLRPAVRLDTPSSRPATPRPTRKTRG